METPLRIYDNSASISGQELRCIEAHTMKLLWYSSFAVGRRGNLWDIITFVNPGKVAGKMLRLVFYTKDCELFGG